MPIVCGTDFSPSAAAAADAAAALAARLGTELHLVHVLTGTGDEILLGTPQESLLDPLKQLLDTETERLRGKGVPVQSFLLSGAPDEVLSDHAKKLEAQLIVVGSVGRRAALRWVVGSTSERTALSASCPVLVLRDADPFGPWLRGERPLRISLGADFSSTTEAAVRWLERLADLGPCEIFVTQVVWPPEAQSRLGLQGPLGLQDLAPEAEEYARRELGERLKPLEQKATVRYEIRPGYGRPADHLVGIATRDRVDLIVVGTHQRSRLDRVRYGSVSRGVLHAAPMAVVCVPPLVEKELGPVPSFGRVLASTDFSEHGDRATRTAYASLPAGGIVRLVHVVERTVSNPIYAQYGVGEVPADDEARARESLAMHLRSLVPPEAEELGIVTEVEVVESNDPAVAIAQAAERFGADLICIGTRGRTGIGKAVLGSVAESVIARTRRPVLVVKPIET
ncbi:universal stress protein [Vulgatibacter sp.]|uniref:universal stress protein n=1 Tax=Vulgatibacter sp. TaxID=1971226 RepID=UPI003566CA1B